jgi:hypothetical protein
LPLLEHTDCYALLDCITWPVSLEVYLDSDNYATGELYLDDGLTLDYLNLNKRALYKLTFSDGLLTSHLVLGDGY